MRRLLQQAVVLSGFVSLAVAQSAPAHAAPAAPPAPIETVAVPTPPAPPAHPFAAFSSGAGVSSASASEPAQDPQGGDPVAQLRRAIERVRRAELSPAAARRAAHELHRLADQLADRGEDGQEEAVVVEGMPAAPEGQAGVVLRRWAQAKAADDAADDAARSAAGEAARSAADVYRLQGLRQLEQLEAARAEVLGGEARRELERAGRYLARARAAQGAVEVEGEPLAIVVQPDGTEEVLEVTPAPSTDAAVAEPRVERARDRVRARSLGRGLASPFPARAPESMAPRRVAEEAERVAGEPADAGPSLEEMRAMMAEMRAEMASVRDLLQQIQQRRARSDSMRSSGGR